MKRILLLAGIGVGYVLGARAGRDRYEQIRTTARRLAADPRVQSAKGKAQDAVATQAAAAADVAKEKVGAATEKVRGDSSAQPTL